MNTVKFNDGTELTASDFTVAIIVGTALAAVTVTMVATATKISEWRQNRRYTKREQGKM